MPQTLLAAFRPDGTWPNIPNAVEADLKAHTPGTGSTTEQTEPPKYHESRHVNEYTSVGQTALAMPAVQGQLQQNFMPSDEDLFAHRSEADVVRSAALYLLHPVNMALSFRSPRNYKCSSEYTTNTPSSDTPFRGKVRSDIVFFRQSGTTMQPMAVLEFKNRGILDHHPDLWNKTLTAQRTSGALLTPQVLASAKFGGNLDYVVANAPDNAAHEMTYFDGNPLILVKQAAAYAIGHRTRYVALFDWNTLILIHFNKLDLASKYCGDSIRTTIIRNQAEMRLALLGFLEMAHHDP
jgi:hypothetical protein